jgi:hypothetical protein
MAEHSQEALTFLKAFTEYLEWRGRNRQEPHVKENEYVTAFGPYVNSCVTTDQELRANLVEKMKDVATARGRGETPVPRERGSG